MARVIFKNIPKQKRIKFDFTLQNKLSRFLDPLLPEDVLKIRDYLKVSEQVFASLMMDTITRETICRIERGIYKLSHKNQFILNWFIYHGFEEIKEDLEKLTGLKYEKSLIELLER